MTENLLQKLEDKMLTLLTEIGDLRKEIRYLTQENLSLKIEREGNAKKLQDLVSLLDAFPIHEESFNNVHNLAVVQE